MAVAAETKQVCLAPVTLLEIVDMHARRPEAQQFVIGALLGGVRQFADRVDLTVATSAVPLLVNPGKDAYAVDIDFFVSQFDLARRASTTAESRLIGWYSTMPASAVSQQHQVTEFDTFFKQALTKFYGPTHALVTVHVNVDVAAAVSGTTRDFIVAQEIDAQNHHTSCDAVVDAAVVESLLISQDSIAEQGTTDEPKSVQQLQAQLTALIDCIEKVGAAESLTEEQVQILTAMSPMQQKLHVGDKQQDRLMLMYVQQLTRLQLDIAKCVNAQPAVKL